MDSASASSAMTEADKPSGGAPTTEGVGGLAATRAWCEEASDDDASAASESDDVATEPKKTDDVVLCGICHKEPRKYCCPRCGALTCSLSCCRAHKARAQCSGRRDVSPFVPMAKMGLKELRSDVAFLEAAERSFETAKRTRDWKPERLGDKKRHRNSASGDNNSKQTSKLQRACDRRNIRLLQMPVGMSKQLRNTTRVARGDRIRWRVEFELSRGLVAEDTLAKTLVIAAADDAATLRDLLLKAGWPGGPAASSKSSRASMSRQDRLQVLAFLLPRVPAPANKKTYDRLDPDVGLDVALAGKCVIEFPVVHVVPETDLASYALHPSPVMLFTSTCGSSPDDVDDDDAKPPRGGGRSAKNGGTNTAAAEAEGGQTSASTPADIVPPTFRGSG